MTDSSNKQLTDGFHAGEVLDEGPFALNVGDVIDESKFVQKTNLTPEQTQALTDLKIAQREHELSVEFWLQFPIEVRPLKFVPGRNRREKRTFRALAAKQERGTITKGRKGKGGQLGKLNALYAELLRAGVVRMAPAPAAAAKDGAS